MDNRSGLTGEQLSYFGVVQRVTGEHATTADVWEAVQAEAARRGEALPGGMFGAVNTLRSYAAELRNASHAFATAPDTNALVSQYVAPLPYGHNPSQTGGPRTFQVRVGFRAAGPEGVDTKTVTLVYPGNLPPTVAELQAEAATLAAVAATGYESEYQGIEYIELGEL